jgi:hypothetical protein
MERDILDPFTKRRKMDLENGKPIK